MRREKLSAGTLMLGRLEPLERKSHWSEDGNRAFWALRVKAGADRILVYFFLRYS
jgi:hypothetical protein